MEPMLQHCKTKSFRRVYHVISSVPAGGILPAARRAALVHMAMQNNFYIIEDDYDSEFCYSGRPISPVSAMCLARVTSVGSFSKTLFPALRLGFAVLPKPLQEAWRHHRIYMGVQNPGEQNTTDPSL